MHVPATSANHTMLSDEKNPGEKTFNDRAPCVKKKASHEARPYRHAVHAPRAADVINKRHFDV